MGGWVLASFEFDTGIARVSELDAAGLYSLTNVRTDHVQTLALFSPDYILQGILSIPGSSDKAIYQYLNFQSPQLPNLVSNGPIITFANLNGLAILTSKQVVASKGDGVPDGASKITGQGSSLWDGAEVAASRPSAHSRGLYFDAPTVDTNNDGIPNQFDPDINGDGIINWLDYDDNGNGIYDIFDPDQNGDLVNDLTPDGHNTDQWYKEGIEYLAVQYDLSPKSDNTTFQSTLTFVTKVRDDVTPIAVQVRGAPSLLNNANYMTKDTQGNPNLQAWNRLLADDGQSEDGSAGDRIFGRKVILADGKAPRANEVVFIQLVFGTSDAPWYVEFPWTFPPVKPAQITAQYDNSTRTIQLVGNPFGSIQDFVWTANVIDSSGKVVWTSPTTSGSNRQLAIPDNTLVSGSSYQYQVTAQSLDKVPGHPAFSIHSIKYDVK